MTTAHTEHQAPAPSATAGPSRPALWRGFSNPAHQSATHDIRLVRGLRSTVWDDQGAPYLDATAGLWFTAVGYGRTQIATAVTEQLQSLHAYSTFGDYTNPRAEELAERLRALAPMPNARVILGSGGSDGIDTACKLARRYWHAMGRPGKTTLIHRAGSYHGMHGFGTSLAGLEPNREGYGDIVHDARQIAPHSPAALQAAIGELGADRVAAFIAEPVIAAGGVLPPVDGYWPKIAQICRDNDILLIADEVVTGFGRVGTWFAAERFGFQPDLLVFAKGVTSGYMPLGGVLAGERVVEPFTKGEGILWRHGYTYSGHPGACAAALANLDIMSEEDLPERAAGLEPLLGALVDSLAGHEIVGSVRSIGLAGALELAPDALAGCSDLADRVVRACRRHGVLTRTIAGPCVQLSPPLVIEPYELDDLAARLRAALDEATP